MTCFLDGNEGHFHYQCIICEDRNESHPIKVEFDENGIKCACTKHPSGIEVIFPKPEQYKCFTS